ncbi:MAG TPA: hypothetical protein PJ993_03035 [Candidatus Saccharibacteria bacterium]|nr:hypothetical protein [Candidatus Saccharibacteria bacterium]HMT39879.1 hypothetical protein [Candidatus Saccharibacteria bacterium]
MTSRKNLSSRTSSSKLRRKMILPGWVVAVVVLSVVGTGLYLVYNSFAISTDPSPAVGVWCKYRRAYEDNGCRLRYGGEYTVYNSVNIRSSNQCTSRKQYKNIQGNLGKQYPNWYCLAG